MQERIYCCSPRGHCLLYISPGFMRQPIWAGLLWKASRPHTIRKRRKAHFAGFVCRINQENAPNNQQPWMGRTQHHPLFATQPPTIFLQRSTRKSMEGAMSGAFARFSRHLVDPLHPPTLSTDISIYPLQKRPVLANQTGCPCQKPARVFNFGIWRSNISTLVLILCFALCCTC
jgi:hypothetical protein